MLDNPILQTVMILAGLFLPFLGMVSILTEYITGFTKWVGAAAKATSSVVGLVLGGAIVVAFWEPTTAAYIGSGFFVLLCITGPSGGHDLIKKFAGQVGNGS